MDLLFFRIQHLRVLLFIPWASSPDLLLTLVTALLLQPLGPCGVNVGLVEVELLEALDIFLLRVADLDHVLDLVQLDLTRLGVVVQMRK